MQTFPSPTFNEHCEKRDKAKAAQLALQQINLKEHADWIVIIAFYQALHWVDAYLISKGHSQPTSHGKRKNVIRSDSSLRPIYRHFDYMHNASEHARYHSWQDYFPEVQVILEKDLNAIISHISPLI